MIFRFLYINIFAFLLIGFSAVIFFLPLEVFFIIFKFLCVILTAAGGIGIFSQWKSKNRKLKILIARNTKQLRLDTFEDLKESPCGRVIADIVLRELRKSENYKYISNANWKKIRSAVFEIKI